MEKPTITSIFIVPTLKVPKNTLRENGFINAYIKDENRDIEYKDCIYLLFHPKDVIMFREFLDNEHERTESIIEDYDYDGGFIVTVYKLDNKWDKDFALVKQGKYSKTSEDFQKMFPKVLKLTKNGLYRDELSLQFRVFNKTNDMIEYWQDKLGVDWNENFEVWEGWNESLEILTEDRLKQLKDEKSE
jgi:hypothetical protein